MEKQSLLEPQLARKTAFVTTTLYPKFDPESSDPFDVDTVRGRLALKTLQIAQNQGLKIVLVEDGSSLAFKNTLVANEIDYLEGGHGMGSGRRQGFLEASRIAGVEYILWSEPEKYTLFRDCLPDFFMPFKNPEVQMVVSNRAIESFPTYPGYQLDTELPVNRLMNRLLVEKGLWDMELDSPTDLLTDPDNWNIFINKYHDKWVDFLFAPRLFKNTPQMVQLYLDKYQSKSNEGFLESRRNPRVNLDIWPNSIVNPVLAALFKAKQRGQKLVDIAVLPYLHPKEQTESEVDSEEMKKKRWEQYVHFVYAAGQMIAYLEGDPKVKIEKVPSTDLS